MIRRSKDKQFRKTSTKDYGRSATYHYSSRRDSSERVTGRKQSSDSEGVKKSRSQSLLSLDRLLPILSVFLVLVGIVYLSLMSSTPHVEFIGSNNFAGDKEKVVKDIADVLDDSFSNKFKLGFDEQKATEALKKSFPQYSEITVNTYIFRRQPVVSIVTAEPVILISNGSNLYIVGDDGRILLDVTKEKAGIDTSKLILVDDQTSVSLEVGKVALSRAQTSFITDVAFQSSQKGLNIATMSIVQGGAELDVKYANTSYIVKYNLFEDPRQSSGVYFALKEKLDAERVTPNEYVDVRVVERAYFR